MKGYDVNLERKKILRFHALGKWRESEKMAKALLPIKLLPIHDQAGNTIRPAHARYNACMSAIARMRTLTDPLYAEWVKLSG